MKRIFLTFGLCLTAMIAFGQKKAVADAARLAKDTKPNFTEAKAKIKAALEHPETKDDAKTWFTAGDIESRLFDSENLKLPLGQTPNSAIMYGALFEVYPYFLKAYELDKIPDAKGKVKPKVTKDMQAIMQANMPYYMNGAIYYFEQKDYKKSYQFFNQMIEIKDGTLIKEGVKPPKKDEEVPVDSQYVFAVYYAAIAAIQSNDSQAAIATLTRASKQDFNQNEMLQYLGEEYRKLNDTLNLEKTMLEGLALFPTEQHFIINLINIYLHSDRHKEALTLLEKAIQADPTSAQLYDVAGRIYETSYKDDVKAEELYLKSIELDPDVAESQSNLGRIYFNRAVAQLDMANEISDMKKYNEEKEKAKELFKKALPYYEKSFKLNSDIPENLFALRNIYYNLDMGDKLKEIEKLTNDGSDGK
ncbi:MAG: hypothetical protein LBD53_00435 [Tannerella sp.]|jgi:tetratricopeptide (TPR) repeat protein|nr:hypothetical protein [Tannerella sp.]